MAQPTTKTIHQVVSPDGKACRAVGTENIWVGYGNPNQQFGVPTGDNEVTPLTTGKLYYAELIKEIKVAKQEIYITGWQVNWDAQLDAKGTRLFDVLLEAVTERNVKVCVMPWDDPIEGLETYDTQTKAALEYINRLTGKNNVVVQLASARADEASSFFSHHQKQVVIDRKVSFIGGLDIAYGRMCDEHYRLEANADGREALNRYNGCIEWTGTLLDTNTVEAAWLEGGWDKNIKNPLKKKSRTNAQITIDKMQQGARWQIPINGLKTIDPHTQPRMPWQDVHCKIVGPATDELVRNFVLRWNSTQPDTKLDLPTPKKYTLENKCLVQVLRSAPLNMRNAEYKVLTQSEKTHWRLPAPLRAQDDILRAMNTLIGKAQHFIYIESQFFVSGFGRQAVYSKVSQFRPAQQIIDAGGGMGRSLTRLAALDDDEPPQNSLLDTLATKLDNVIRDSCSAPFHVYITLPVHPEGKLNEGSIVGQVYWTMQTLVFGSQSLLNRIRRSLKAKQIYDADPNENWKKAYAHNDKGYEDIPLEKCFEYVTLLNLRNWTKLGSGKNERYVTEQVYIHSKLMIVDDRYAVLGSANINDRSLLGTRDSELAVLVVDTDNKQRDLKKNGKQVPVRAFARELRKQVWRKIFGITAGGSKAATELADAVLHPAAPASWKAIQKRAKQNTELYEAAFDWIPRNKYPFAENEKTAPPASIWPIWDSSAKTPEKAKRGLMPFEADFWEAPRHNPAAANLKKVKGFITFLPIHWTRNEDNKIPYHNKLLTHLEQQRAPLDNTTIQITSIDKQPDNEEINS